MDPVSEQQKAVQALRKKMLQARENGPPVSVIQKRLNVEKPVRGPFHVTRFSITAPPEKDLENLLNTCVHNLCQPSHKILPASYAGSLEAQWTRPIKGDLVAALEQEVSKPDRQLCQAEYALSEPTILFLQGGSFVYGSPVTARPFATQLSKGTGARVLTIAYRLAPQHTFPAFLLDALVAYFSLLAPHQTSVQHPIPPSKIVLAGESAGGTIALALVKLLTLFRRQGVDALRFNGRMVPISMPAAVACLSPCVDWTVSLPSCSRYSEQDWSGGLGPWLDETQAADHIWPSTPPRGEAYVDASGLTHPLLSPAAVEDWQGCPPLYLSTGEESLTDGIMLIAQNAARHGVPVRFTQYEGMPHLFYSLMGRSKQAEHNMSSWTRFCKDALDHSSSVLRSRGEWFDMKAMNPKTLNVKALTALTNEEAARLMEQGRQRRMTWVWVGPTASIKSTM